MNIKGIDTIREYLPKGWENKCKELGLIKRAREIKNAEDLLMLILLYLTEGESFQITSALMKATGTSVNKIAVYKRFKNSWSWLKWISENICKQNSFLYNKPKWLENKRVCLVDASDVALKNSNTSDYRLHCMFDLFDFSFRSLEITTVKEGEKISRYKVQKNDILIADRAYGTILGIEYTQNNNANFIFRLRTMCFNIYNFEGKRINILNYATDLKDWGSKELICYYKHDNILKPIKICIMKKDQFATMNSLEKLRKKNKKNANKNFVSAASTDFNNYIVLATNLDYDGEKIFELYRARWQIESVFKRLKSLFSLGNVPSKNPDSVKSWFYGKLLLAAICESIVKRSHFSPKD